MSNIESIFSPEYNEESELDERGRVIERLTSKFPRFKSLIMAFITTTASLSAPELIEADAGTETATQAMEKITDQEFKESVNKIENLMALVGSNIPTNSVYSEIWGCKEINRGVTIDEIPKGELPESAQNVFIGHQQLSGNVIGMLKNGEKDTANIMDATKSVFYISPAEGGSIIEGGATEIKGVGHTRSEALQNALENAAGFLGETVSSNSELVDKTSDNGSDSHINNSFTEVIQVNSHQFISEYRIINGEETNDGNVNNNEYHVTIEIKGGTFTPEK